VSRERERVGPYVDAVVSSVDVGCRKLPRAMFEAALAAAHRPPQHRVMIGNSEQSVQLALALGMRTLLVALENPKPPKSAAHAVSPTMPRGRAPPAPRSSGAQKAPHRVPGRALTEVPGGQGDGVIGVRPD
jgi:beta-phosphoglucomutase-like phosphatase (HAD superfamily)